MTSRVLNWCVMLHAGQRLARLNSWFAFGTACTLCSVGSLLTISTDWPDLHAEHVRHVVAALLIEHDGAPTARGTADCRGRPSRRRRRSGARRASPTTTVSSVDAAPGCTQFGSESMRTTPGFGGVPSNVILPAILPAVAASTGLTVGAGVAGAAFSGPAAARRRDDRQHDQSQHAARMNASSHQALSKRSIMARGFRPPRRSCAARGPASTSDPTTPPGSPPARSPAS